MGRVWVHMLFYRQINEGESSVSSKIQSEYWGCVSRTEESLCVCERGGWAWGVCVCACYFGLGLRPCLAITAKILSKKGKSLSRFDIFFCFFFFLSWGVQEINDGKGRMRCKKTSVFRSFCTLPTFSSDPPTHAYRQCRQSDHL